MSAGAERPRRVLQVYGPLDGGVAEHVLGLSRGLRERGWEVEVAAPAGSPTARVLESEGHRLHPLPFGRAPHPRDLATLRALRAIDRRRGFDVVHAHSSKAGALVRAALPRRERLVYTPHCFAFAAAFGRLGGLQRQSYRAAEQLLLPRTGAVIAASRWEQEAGRRGLRGLESRMSVVYNGVPPCDDPQPDPDLLAFKGGARLAGIVAVLRPQKDPLTLVRAAAVLERRGRLDFKVAVVGNGELREAVVVEIERLNLAEKVRWFAFTGGSARYLAALDVFVLPSLWESLPISILEAFACGCAVVASRVCGTPEAVEDRVSGRLVEPADVPGLADALDDLLRDPEQIARLGDAGREVHERRFGLERMVDEISAVYERRAGGRGHTG
jgi:glycosyltransferase involved in cell wall biosynthesis